MRELLAQRTSWNSIFFFWSPDHTSHCGPLNAFCIVWCGKMTLCNYPHPITIILLNIWYLLLPFNQWHLDLPRYVRKRKRKGLCSQDNLLPDKILICIIIPTICDHSFDAPATLRPVITGYASDETTIGPRKVRGTTPGNSKWSYWKRNRRTYKN